jgi:hypothetical protein
VIQCRTESAKSQMFDACCSDIQVVPCAPATSLGAGSPNQTIGLTDMRALYLHFAVLTCRVFHLLDRFAGQPTALLPSMVYVNEATICIGATHATCLTGLIQEPVSILCDLLLPSHLLSEDFEDQIRMSVDPSRMARLSDSPGLCHLCNACKFILHRTRHAG